MYLNNTHNKYKLMNTLHTFDEYDNYNDYDDYEYGVDKTSKSITYIDTENGQVCLENNEIINPLFVGLNGGSLIELEDKEIYKTYKRLFVICMKNDFTESDELYKLYNKVVNATNFYKLGKYFVLIKTNSLTLLRNNDYKTRACVVEESHLRRLFGDKQKYDPTEIVIPMFELTKSTALINISLYEKQFGIENLGDIFKLSSFYNKNYKKPIIDQLANHLAELRESQFWNVQRNCNINMSDLFMERCFKYKNKLGERSNKDIDDVIENLMNNKAGVNYLDNIYKPAQYADIYTALKNSKNRTYYANLSKDDLKVKQEDISKLLCSIDNENELYYAVNSLLISKEYCHMVLNDGKVLDKIKPLFDKYGPVYKLLIGYAWLCFVLEEGIMKTHALKSHRYIFDINTANKLPTFPFLFEDLTQNPYLTVLVDKKLLSAQNNAVSVNCINDFDGYGVCNLEQFKWRFNLFTSQDPSKDLFDGIDWSSFSISGSVIPACLQKKSPLFDCVASSNQREEDKWLTFFNHYYTESDIDMMCNDPSIFGFCEKVDQVVKQLQKNIQTNGEGADVKVVPVKSMIINVTKHFFEERLYHFNEKYNTKHTPETFMADIESNDVKEYLYLLYLKQKTRSNGEIRKAKKDTNSYIKSFMALPSISEMSVSLLTADNTDQSNKIADSDIYLYVNDVKKKGEKSDVEQDKNKLVMTIRESVRFKISSKKMLRTIELFRTHSNDFFSLVGKFHLPCVRAYYVGDNVYIAPSCITAMMTGINIDYKYFAGVRDPIEIINKYRMRGFGTLLSENEKKHMIYYNNNVKTFGGMFHLPSTTKEDINKMFSPKDINDKLFHPLVFTNELSDDVYNNPPVNYIKTMQELKNYYKKKYGYDCDKYKFDIFKFTTINDTGYINPYVPWVSKAYYEMASETKKKP